MSNFTAYQWRGDWSSTPLVLWNNITFSYNELVENEIVVSTWEGETYRLLQTASNSTMEYKVRVQRHRALGQCYTISINQHLMESRTIKMITFRWLGTLLKIFYFDSKVNFFSIFQDCFWATFSAYSKHVFGGVNETGIFDQIQ